MRNVKPTAFTMSEETLAKLDELKDFTKATTRTQAIRYAIDIANEILSEIKVGNTIVIRDKKGKEKIKDRFVI